jgi:septal ring factor EnvC (AmiA/AmiB activator)
MRTLFTIILSLILLAPVGAQQKKTTSKKATTTQRTNTTRKTTTTTKSRQASTSRKSSTSKQSGKTGKTSKTRKSTSKAPVYTNAEIKGLQSQRAVIKKKIQEQEKLLRANRADVKKRLDNLLVINSEIDERQKKIEDIQKDITHIEGNIDLLKAQLATLESQLKDRQQKYLKSLRYMARHSKIQDQLMFVFSAKNFNQMYRRLRFVREYAAFQRAQGELVKAKQEQIASKHQELEKEKGNKNNLLYKGKKEQAALQGKKDEQQ